MTRPGAYLVAFAAGVFALVAGCGRSGDQVVVYVSADEQVARPILAAFERETGIAVVAKFDTEATKTTGLANQIRSERERPRADVFWSSEVFQPILLAEEGLLSSLDTEQAQGWPREWCDPDHRWHAFAARARVIVYAPSRVQPHEVPVAWTDLTRDWWKGRVVMADPRFGTTRGHLGAMKAYWDREFMPGYYGAFLDGLADNEIRFLPSGNAGVVEAIAAGEADVGMTDTDDAWAAQARGVDLAVVYPMHDREAPTSGGTLLVPNAVGLVKGGPNPGPAERLADYLLSPATESALLRSPLRCMPLRPDRIEELRPEELDGCAVPAPLRVGYVAAANAAEAAVQAAMNAIDR